MNMKTVSTALLDQGATRWSSRAAAQVLSACMKDSSIPIPRTIINQGTVVLEWDKNASIIVNADGTLTGMSTNGKNLDEAFLKGSRDAVGFIRTAIQ